jgi:hypothetical protein
MNNTMRDKFGRLIVPGDHVVYAGRKGSYTYLKSATVIETFPEHVTVRSQGGEGPIVRLQTPEYIAILLPL